MPFDPLTKIWTRVLGPPATDRRPRISYELPKPGAAQPRHPTFALTSRRVRSTRRPEASMPRSPWQRLDETGVHQVLIERSGTGPPPGVRTTSWIGHHPRAHHPTALLRGKAARRDRPAQPQRPDERGTVHFGLRAGPTSRPEPISGRDPRASGQEIFAGERRPCSAPISAGNSAQIFGTTSLAPIAE